MHLLPAGATHEIDISRDICHTGISKLSLYEPGSGTTRVCQIYHNNRDYGFSCQDNVVTHVHFFFASFFVCLKPPPRCLLLPYVLLSTRRNKTKSSSHIKKGFIRSSSTERAGLGEAKKLQSLVI